MSPLSVVFLENTITEPRPAPSKVHIAHAAPTINSKATFGWPFLFLSLFSIEQQSQRAPPSPS
jgi:hypothetical protein